MNPNPMSKNSTTVRFSIPPAVFTAPLRFAPWLGRPVLTRLFLSPFKRTPSPGAASGQVIGTLRVAQSLVRVRARGRGPTVALVHGWQASAAHLKPVGDRLVDAGYTVVTWDMPAHGETKGSMTSLPEFIETLEGAARLVGPLHGVVAHSLGATAATIAMSRGLSVESAVLVAPMPSFDFALDEFSKILGLSQELREVAARGAEERVGLSRREADLRRLPRPTARTAIAHDRDDVRVPFQSSSELADAWALRELFATSGLGHKRVLSDEGLLEWIVRRMHATEAPSVSPLAFDCAPEMSL